jgi:flagella basal body P-ring formation protein FlgA
LVVRGSLVMMKIQTSLMTVTAQGKAQQDGAMGETIRVLNTQSNRVVEGVVTAPGVIDIHMAQRMTVAEVETK